MTRAYLRLFPDVYERKVLGIRGPDEPPRIRYSSAQFSAFIGTMVFSEMVNPRGRFKSRRVLEALLAGPDDQGADIAAQVGFLVDQGDLERQPDGSLYFEGWDEAQEGRDPSVNERMARYRNRKRGVPKTLGAGDGAVTSNASVTGSGVTAKSRPPLTAKRPEKKDRANAREVAMSSPGHIVRRWLSDHGAQAPVGWVNTTLNELIGVYGYPAVVAIWESAPKDVRTSRQFVQLADRALSPDPRDVVKAEDEAERAKAKNRGFERTQEYLAGLRGTSA